MPNNSQKIDTSKAFQFIAVDDCGEGARCPHCNAEGRYIYAWAEFGELKAAMAGCFKLLTGKIKKTDVEAFIEKISIKQAKRKPLNGWDKTVLRMQEYIRKNAEDPAKVSWAESKIFEAVSDCKKYAAKVGR